MLFFKKAKLHKKLQCQLTVYWVAYCTEKGYSPEKCFFVNKLIFRGCS